MQLSASDVQIEGPFGNLAVNISNFSTVIFIAGGIGVTPMINAIGTACKRGMFRDGVKVCAALLCSGHACQECWDGVASSARVWS